MNYVSLGSSGLKVSELCLGTMTYGDPQWRDYVLDEKESRPFFEKALELGINFFDTADGYSIGESERVVGSALSDLTDREQYVLATKVFLPMGPGPNQRGLSAKHLMSAVDDSLRRLGTEYIDIYWIHRWDDTTPIAETMEALHRILESGKVRYIGASSMFAWQFAKAQHTADLNDWSRFIGMQNHYNLVYREEEREMIPMCRDQGVGICPWSPLARGFLAGNRGKHRSEGETERAKSDVRAEHYYYRDSDFAVLDAVESIADKRGIEPAQVALAWLLNKPYVDAPIIGATKLWQLESAVDALRIDLTDAEIERLERPYRPKPVMGHA